MDAWECTDIVADHAARGRLYHEFLRVPDLSAGIYVLEAGPTDPQSPHPEHELYYVVAGRAVVTVGSETRPVVPGSLIFVAATVPHRFHDIAERLARLRTSGPAARARPRPTTGAAQQPRGTRARAQPHARPRRGGRMRRHRRRPTGTARCA